MVMITDAVVCYSSDATQLLDFAVPLIGLHPAATPYHSRRLASASVQHYSLIGWQIRRR